MQTRYVEADLGVAPAVVRSKLIDLGVLLALLRWSSFKWIMLGVRSWVSIDAGVQKTESRPRLLSEEVALGSMQSIDSVVRAGGASLRISPKRNLQKKELQPGR